MLNQLTLISGNTSHDKVNSSYVKAPMLIYLWPKVCWCGGMCVVFISKKNGTLPWCFPLKHNGLKRCTWEHDVQQRKVPFSCLTWTTSIITITWVNKAERWWGARQAVTGAGTSQDAVLLSSGLICACLPVASKCFCLYNVAQAQVQSAVWVVPNDILTSTLCLAKEGVQRLFIVRKEGSRYSALPHLSFLGTARKCFCPQFFPKVKHLSFLKDARKNRK